MATAEQAMVVTFVGTHNDFEEDQQVVIIAEDFLNQTYTIQSFDQAYTATVPMIDIEPI